MRLCLFHIIDAWTAIWSMRLIDLATLISKLFPCGKNILQYAQIFLHPNSKHGICLLNKSLPNHTLFPTRNLWSCETLIRFPVEATFYWTNLTNINFEQLLGQVKFQFATGFMEEDAAYNPKCCSLLSVVNWQFIPINKGLWNQRKLSVLF